MTATSKAAATLGRKGGKSTSEAKRAASAANGKSGGRKTLYVVTVRGDEPPSGYTVTTEGVESLIWDHQLQTMTSAHEVLATGPVLEADDQIISYRKGSAED